MHRFAFLNNEILPARNANVNAVSSAALYGKGIFTTLAVHDKKTFLWEKHWRRIKDNAAKTGIDLRSFEEEFVKGALAALIEKNEIETARARITFFDESPPAIWDFEAERKTSLLIQTADLRKVKNDLSLTVSPFPVNSRSPLAGVKSCNYLENIFALENARAGNFDEAFRSNERGEIASASMANVFWYEKGKLFTPSLETGCLAGTTREFVMENVEVVEVEKNINDFLRDAETVFLTSAGIGVVRVADCLKKFIFSPDSDDLSIVLQTAITKI